MSEAPHLDIDLTSPAFKANPYPVYARLRSEAPVCRVTLRTGEEAHLVARYSDVAALLKDKRLVKDPANALSAEALATIRRPPEFFSALQRNMLGLDDPDHLRLKRLVQTAFTPRRVDELVEPTQTVSSEFLASALSPTGILEPVRDRHVRASG